MANKEKKAWIVFGIFILYLVFNYYMVKYFPINGFINYIIKPLICIAIIVYLNMQTKPRTDISIKQKPFLIVLSTVVAVLYLVIFFALGFIEGFGNNPFDTSPRGIMLNVINFFPLLILTEQLRSYFLHSFSRKKRILAIFILITVLTISSFTPATLMKMFTSTFKENVEFLGSKVFTEISKNALLTYLSLLGGFRASITVRMGFESIHFFFSVLPNLKWITIALLDNLYPILSLIFIRNTLIVKENRDRRISEEKIGLSWIVTYLFSIFLVWFAVGLFPVFPTLILTGSMEPDIYPGDILIVQKVDQESIEVGDIIQFLTEESRIVHRVIDIVDGKFRTKGDNNNVEDSALVESSQIKGKIIYRIPYVGRPIVFIRSRSDKTTNREVNIEYELEEGE